MGRKGTLYLTDRRLIFEWSEGIVTKKYQQVGISLADIQVVNAVHGRLGGREISVTTRDGNNGFRTNRIIIGIAMSPEIWMTKINNVLNTMSHSELQQPTMILQKEVVKIPCKYCGNLIDAFRSNSCPKCGAPIY